VNTAAEFSDLFQNEFDGFRNDNLFACNQSQDGVWGSFNEFNKVRVDDEEVIVETRELNHGGVSCTRYRRICVAVQGPISVFSEI